MLCSKYFSTANNALACAELMKMLRKGKLVVTEEVNPSAG